MDATSKRGEIMVMTDMVMADMDMPEVEAIGELVKGIESEDVIIADVGTHYGGSCLAIGKALNKAGKKKFLIVTVDSFEDVNVCKEFIDKLGCLIEDGTICPVITSSVKASFLVRDKIFDLVYIDADHKYSSVMGDIKAWLPKVRPGGIICGHDCEGYYNKFTKGERANIKEHLEDEKTDIDIHPGVVKAVWDCFGFHFKIMPNTRIWWVRVNEDS